MTSESCNVDCKRTVELLAPNPDITGIGISIANTATAGLALCVVISYYAFSYGPTQTACAEDGRHNRSESTLPPKQNPIDVYFLNWRFERSRKRIVHDGDEFRSSRTHAALTNCMLVMSDFQLITGFAMILSGFSQLHCGIATYHWLRITRLAWFACLTHLCCLTFLRDYFLANKAALYWRLPAMLTLAVMLTVALVPTSHLIGITGHERVDSYTDILTSVRRRPTAADPVRCYWNHHTINGTYDTEVISIVNQIYQAARQKMIVAIVLLGYGVLSRVWRLYKTPTDIYLRIRSTSDLWISQKLAALHVHVQPRTLSASVLVVVAYRPALALMLSMRLVLDIVTSKALEVWWLVLSFAWGALNLWIDSTESSSRQWTFGQVIATVLLLAPCASLFDGYFAGSTMFERRDDATALPNHESLATPTLFDETRLPQASSISFACVEVNRLDFYAEHAAFQVLVWTTLAFFGAVCTISLLLFRFGFPLQLIDPRFTHDSISPYLVVTPISLPVTVMIALSMKRKPVQARVGRLAMNAFYCLILAWSLVMPSLSVIYRGYALSTSIALYFFISIGFVVQRLHQTGVPENLTNM